MNDVMDVLKTRRSIRRFKTRMPERRVIESVIEAGLYAPCAMGRQYTKVIAITDRSVRDTVANINRQIGGWEDGMDSFYGAPVILLVIARKDWPQRVYDGSLVLGNMMNAAHALGLGSCWIHRAKEELEMDYFKKILADLGIEGEWEGIGHLALGEVEGNYPKAPARDPDRMFFIE